MIALTLGEIAEIVGGRLHRADGSETVASTVEFDTRKLTDGGLFVALPGERVDGHDFAAQAVAAGASGVLAAREVDAPAVIVPAATEVERPGTPMALLGDRTGAGASVLAGLAALARQVAGRLSQNGLTIVGVTGSSGKTSTKDLIAQVLEPMGATVAPPGSFNNELGHPWTVLRSDRDTRHLVLELSARGPGHIAELCSIAPPRIGVVLNVGTAHLGEFGSQEAVARTKGELPAALPSEADGGVAILNLDDPRVAQMAERTSASVVYFGQRDGAQVRAVDVQLDSAARPSFRLISPQGEAEVRLALHGAHQVDNALAAAAVALELGATPQEVAERLSSARRLSARRMEVTERPDGVVVVNDSYNANPESMRAALRTLATMARETAGEPRRSWAVLGVMGELGTDETSAHDEIGRLAVRLNISRLVVVGDRARPMYQGACLEGSYGNEAVLVPDVAGAIDLLGDQMQPGDVVLVKASKAAELWRVADAILDGSRASNGGTS
ncbi:UDP-N-acetylmuramoyl-tripeptide--D-alanyl-D-alanine ligase [Actinoalloteichus hymeniacidonis]|uniref:UDP-N-acetylmuramoyl-tripeptide--D-alanyl-D-alanine ligase n=1 Tax=Actinoalloteichus hymeniacidonis TaxID=340345 RepID=A0AAC9HNZ8_9PSEU|nr:UDP-N-acetylmuramoyl-tripeptide--D-alanyl-D-alanine ligase [Actinoalloteichus hymeniacidonis]AOS62708.1 UDP-N-acetylmuramoyl-tripeptide--D-alanyl-D-alanine ligase [Actinoalloteichus hymeniacidonis]MBB5909261.1 UDP-N-acetylmuramoyl-tripeptide--D-alanyl-D-alanine ligase [Actinoalloteichus hymeniacidonis]